MKRTMLAVITLSLAAAYQAPAQDAESSARGVARLSLLSGDVSVRRGDTGEWVAAAVNAPVLSEDQVLTGANSKAEVQFDFGNFARLSGNAELRLADIENRRYLIRLARGTVSFRVLRSTESQTEISTPSVAIRPMKKGLYRVSVLEDGTTEVTVRSGEAEIFTPQGSQRLKSGKMLMARGAFSDPEFQFANAQMLDDWDRWNEGRDRQLERSQSYDYVSQDISGAEDLDGHGRWENTPEYGNVWVPAATADWAPYRNGRWSWVDYYGWNWISYDPWGWAPYHYGRWINRPSVGWCWWPGRMGGRHYWSPGLVGFFGWGGGGFSMGVGFGNWGWVPLAPFETYYPWYGRGYYGGYRNHGYGHNNVTIVNNTNITNIYRNARYNGGITAVNANEFGRGSVNAVRFNRSDVERASMVRGQLPLVPDAASTRMSDRSAQIAEGRGASRADNSFYSTRQATRLDRVPFETQRSALQATSQRSAGGEAVGGRGSVDRGSDNGGWRRFGDSTAAQQSGQTGAAPAASGRGVDNNSWRRMGDAVPNSNSAVDRGGGSGGSGASGRGSDNSGWRRFGDSTSSSTPNAPSAPATRGSDSGSWRRMGDQVSAPSIDRGSNRSIDRGSSGGGRGSSSMDSAPRMSAPTVVRERSSPDYGNRGGGGNYGGYSGGAGRSSAPRMESAPRSAPSAPSGGGRSSGGGGGRGGDSGGSRGQSHGGGGGRGR